MRSHFVYCFQGDGFSLGQFYCYFTVNGRNTSAWGRQRGRGKPEIWGHAGIPLDYDQDCNVFAAYKLLYANPKPSNQGGLKEVIW